MITFDASELLLCFQESCGGPAQRLISFSPTLYVASHPLHRGQTRFDRLVVASFRRNTAPIPKRCTVSVSSKPSSKLRAAVGLIRSNCWRIFSNAALASVSLFKAPFAQHPQLIATGRNELPTHAALFDPVAFQNTLHRSQIVPCGQSGHFLALAGSYSRSFQRDILSTEDHVAQNNEIDQLLTRGVHFRPLHRREFYGSTETLVSWRLAWKLQPSPFGGAAAYLPSP